MGNSLLPKILGAFLVLMFIDKSFSFLAGPSPEKRLHKLRGTEDRRAQRPHGDLQTALKQLRDSKKIQLSEEKKREIALTSQQKKQHYFKHPMKRANTRVSFKECNLEPGRRLDCGAYGINEEGCAQRECCWGETTEPDVPWCYHSIPTIESKCLLDNTERVECGWYGIRKEQCLASNCCWQPTNDGSVPWCFSARRIPIYAGECGVPDISPFALTRIVGGMEAKPNSWPWMVSLQIDQDHFCGGSLINDQWIVSAAHCEPAFRWGTDREIVLGMHSQAATEPTQIRVEVDLLVPHEDYGKMSGMDNDILLIKLKRSVDLDSTAITPVCLPESGSELSDGKRCYSTGWGHTKFMGSAPDKLQQVMVPIIDNSVCNEGDWYGGQVDDTMICAGYEEGGRDSCQGDSGGPLVCYIDDKWTLSGIVSWGDGCASERKPGIYAKTSKFIEWIEAKINENQ